MNTESYRGFVITSHGFNCVAYQAVDFDLGDHHGTADSVEQLEEAQS